MVKRTTPVRAKTDPRATFSYKNYEDLRRFITTQGSILSRSETRLTQKQQRGLAKAIKRARHLALLPFTQTV